MKFNFDKDVSRIYDYLMFPRIYYFDKEYEDKNDEIEEMIHEDYKEMAEHLIEKLRPHEKDINQFFQQSIYSSYDYSNILIHAFPVEGYKDEHQYLEEIKNEDDQVFKDKIIKALPMILIVGGIFYFLTHRKKKRGFN